MKKPETSGKSVLIIGINFSPELTGIGKYTGEMADWLVKNDYKCRVVTSFPYYPFWKVQAPYTNKFYKKEVSNDGMLTVYRCPLYVPQKPSGLKRLIHDASFFISAFLMTFYLLFKPKADYIFCIAPPFHLGFLGLFYRLFRGGKIVYHIQDLQIEAARDLQILKSKKVFTILFALERFIMQRVNVISSISGGMLKKIALKTNKEITFFPNWVDTKMYYPLNDSREDLKKTWGFEADDKVVLYSGSIGEKQGLEAIITVAKELHPLKFIKFIICGTGPHKATLVASAEEHGLTNVKFFPLQEAHLFNSFLNMADVHLILQKRNASDLMMPSKLTTILAVGGLSLVTAEPGTALFELLNDNEMGVVIPPEDTDSLKNAIYDCCIRDNSSIKNNGRKYAEQYLNKNNIIEKTITKLKPVPPSSKESALKFELNR
ncbi:colanic acid biosynthesis fucosyltransferase WcaI [Mucilaginibacter gynuensis]|uniref:Colanic acid biosynthesis fucosyltransferase WcaI n=1 Tax=Mucilaginibacter gynuensis TaxID=1302236 RepID=A0ABP8G3H0_9SPHI